MSDEKKGIEIGNISASVIAVGQSAKAIRIRSGRTFDFGRLATSPDDNHQQLRTLFKELEESLAHLPLEQEQGIAAVYLAGQDALDEAAKEQTDASRLVIRGEILLNTVKPLTEFIPNLLSTAVQIAKTLTLIR